MKKMYQSILLAVMIISSYSLLPATAQAATYFKCPPGFNWQLNGNRSAVRCSRSTQAVVQNIRCPNVRIPVLKRSIGTFPTAKSGKDKCKGTFKVAGVSQTTEHAPLKCASGFQYRQNYSGNTDKCVKPGTTSVVAPTLRINQ